MLKLEPFETVHGDVTDVISPIRGTQMLSLVLVEFTDSVDALPLHVSGADL